MGKSEHVTDTVGGVALSEETLGYGPHQREYSIAVQLVVGCWRTDWRWAAGGKSRQKQAIHRKCLRTPYSVINIQSSPLRPFSEGTQRPETAKDVDNSTRTGR